MCDPDKTRAIIAVGILFLGPDMQDVERALDPIELTRTDPLWFLIQAYCFLSGATCEAAAAPAGGLVSGSARNLPTICGTSAELMRL